MTRAPRLTAQRIAFASTAASISPSAVATLATSSSRREGHACDSLSVVDLRGDEAGHERPVPDRIVGRAAHEALRGKDVAREIRVADVDPRVDDGDGDGIEERQLCPEVEGAYVREMPLARGERIVGEERRSGGNGRASWLADDRQRATGRCHGDPERDGQHVVRRGEPVLRRRLGDDVDRERPVGSQVDRGAVRPGAAAHLRLELDRSLHLPRGSRQRQRQSCR